MADANEDMTSSNLILFTDGNAYTPQYVYLNNATITHSNILNGGGAARAFHQGDKFEVWIRGLNSTYDEESEDKIVVRLADYTSSNPSEWTVNTTWQQVDLTPLGEVYGLSFTVISTDQGSYGTNTATYFALDGLTMSNNATTAVEDVATQCQQATKTIVNGKVVITRDNTKFDILGNIFLKRINLVTFLSLIKVCSDCKPLLFYVIM